MLIEHDGIGICNICGKKLLPVPRLSPFEGTPNVKFVLSAYYYNDMSKKLIYRYKFAREIKFAELFADMIYNYVKDFPLKDDFDCITAVPLSLPRFKTRGFNQAEIIAKLLSDMLEIPYISCVFRSGNTVAQSLLKRRDRLHNTRNAFIADKKNITGKRILLFDDIFTTGSTIDSCANELINKDAVSVAGISFARADYLHHNN